MYELNITNAVYVRNLEDTDNVSITITVDGNKLSVPLDPANRHYAEIMRQVDAGELTIQDAD